jgi:serine/threonine protein kinase
LSSGPLYSQHRVIEYYQFDSFCVPCYSFAILLKGLNVAVKCPQCDTDNPSDSKFCRECAAPLPSSKEIPVTKILETSTEELTAGSTFAGRYQIIEELGKGGMGKVYRVLDKELKEEVALKLITPEIASDKKTLERFSNELKLARKITHKNICRMYELMEEGGTRYITMEYVAGEDLKSFIRRADQLTVGKAISIAKQVCEGLSEAHKLGVVHRDMKPQNIMIDKEGNARIMDFGIARSLKTKGITGTGMIIGTPEYMSPEQVEGKEVDQRADIYAVGVILYEMMTGRVPFEGETPLGIAMKHKRELPKNPRELNAQIPEDISRVIMRCMEKAKENRYQSAEETHAALEKIEKGIQTAEKKVPKRKPIILKKITVKLSPKKLVIPIVVLASLAAVVVLSIILVKTLLLKKPIPPAYTQLTFTGNVSEPAVSPDGNFIAYIEIETFDEQKVMVQDIISGQTIEVFRAQVCTSLKWLPDSSELSLGAYNEKDSRWYAYVMPRLGGTYRRLHPNPVSSWSPDGSQYTSPGRASKEITIIDKSSGDFRKIPLQGSFKWFVDDDWSPLGNFLLFLTIDENERYTIWTVSIDGSNQQKVVEENAQLSSPQWSPQGDAIYYFLSRGQVKELWKVQVSTTTGKDTKPPELVLGGLQAGNHFSFTDNGKKLVYTREINYSNLWLVTIEDSGKDTSVRTKQLTSGTSIYRNPRISPDGSRLTFSMCKGSRENIYIMPIEGGSARQVTFLDSLNSCPAWSPDGKVIAFGSNEGGSFHVWKVKAEGGRPYQFEKSRLSASLFVSWAPGNSILYQRPGNRNFHILNPVTEEEIPLVEDESVGWMFVPQRSPDGKKVAVSWNRTDQSPRGGWIISLEDSSQKLVKKGHYYFVGWKPDGKWVYISLTIQGELKINMVSPESGQEKEVFTVPFSMEEGIPDSSSVSVSPDGKQFVFNANKKNSDVWLVENFDPDMK